MFLICFQYIFNNITVPDKTGISQEIYTSNSAKMPGIALGKEMTSRSDGVGRFADISTFAQLIFILTEQHFRTSSSLLRC
jgi:hypothetical protein